MSLTVYLNPVFNAATKRGLKFLFPYKRDRMRPAQRQKAIRSSFFTTMYRGAK